MGQPVEIESCTKSTGDEFRTDTVEDILLTIWWGTGALPRKVVPRALSNLVFRQRSAKTGHGRHHSSFAFTYGLSPMICSKLLSIMRDWKCRVFALVFPVAHLLTRIHSAEAFVLLCIKIEYWKFN